MLLRHKVMEEVRRKQLVKLILGLGLLAVVSANGSDSDDGTDEFAILMPEVKPTKPETYLCTPIRVDPTQNHYIVGFNPNATMHVAHHMLVTNKSYF